MYDKFGQNYTGTLAVAENGKACLHWHLHGFRQDRFPPGDDPKHFCRNPRNTLGHTAVKPWCFVATSGPKLFAYCNIKQCDCPFGSYGPNCQLFCHCRNVTETCHAVTGSCTSGCADGWIGLDCQKKCFHGMFGRHCARTCSHCITRSCDPETGNCKENCGTGNSGPNCPQECKEPRFGHNCEHKCHCHNVSEICNQVNGSCTSGCADEWFGLNCSNSVNQMVTPIPDLEDSMSTILASTGSAVAALLLIISSIAVCMYRKRRSREVNSVHTSNADTREINQENEKGPHSTETSNLDGPDRDSAYSENFYQFRPPKQRSHTVATLYPTDSMFQPSSLLRSSHDLPRSYSSIGSIDIFGSLADEPQTSQSEECYGANRFVDEAKEEAPSERKKIMSLGQRCFTVVPEGEEHMADIPYIEEVKEADCDTGPSLGDEVQTCKSQIQTRAGQTRHSKQVRITQFLDKTFWN